jgi:hypothetical protein
MSGARPFRMVARMPDDAPRDMRHLSKQFPGLRTFIPSNPQEGGRCSLYAASERPRPCCDQHRLILHTNEPGGREVQRAGHPRPGNRPGQISPGGLAPGQRPVRYEDARPTGQMAEGRTAGTGWRIPGWCSPGSRSPGCRGAARHVPGSAVLDDAVLGSGVLDDADLRMARCR